MSAKCTESTAVLPPGTKGWLRWQWWTGCRLYKARMILPFWVLA